MQIENEKENNYKNIVSELQNWEPENYFKDAINKNGAIAGIISGSSKSGKSNLLKYLLVGKPNISKYFDFIIVFSKTLVNNFFQGFLDSKLLFGEFKPEVISDIKLLYKQKKEQGIKFRTLIILDDMIDSRSKYNRDIEELYFMGRHWKLSCIVLSQKLSLLSTAWMANSMFIILLFAGSRNEKNYCAEKIISDAIPEKYAGKSLKALDWCAYMIHSVICQDYQSLVVLPYEKENKMFKFKAPLMSKDKKKKITSIYENFIKL